MIDEFETAENDRARNADMWRNAELICLLAADGAYSRPDMSVLLRAADAADAVGYGARGPTWIRALKMLSWHADPLEAAARCAEQAAASCREVSR